MLAVEIRQFVGTGLRTLVPRIIGQTAEAQQKETVGVRERRQWDEARFFEQITQQRRQAESSAARRILEWARERQLKVSWGHGTTTGSFSAKVPHQGNEHSLLNVYGSGYAEMAFEYVRHPPFSDRTERLGILKRLNELSGVSIGETQVDVRPTIPFVSLKEGLDLGSASGRLQLAILAALSQFERERLRERTIAGLERARAQGKRLGRPSEPVPIEKLASVKGVSVRDGAKRLGVARSTLQRWRALARQNPSL